MFDKFSPANLWASTDPIKTPIIMIFCNFLNFVEIFVIFSLFLSDKLYFFADKRFPEWLNWPIKGVIISTEDDSFSLDHPFLSDF